jgi:predicted nucleic acid-binding protein
VLLDTSGLLSFLDDSDAHHARATQLFKTAGVRLTHSYVLAELVPLCRVRRLSRAKTLAFAATIVDNEDVEIVWVDKRLHRAAVALLKARPDKDYSLCDAVSFILMRRRGITEALTTDSHFEREGFVRLLKPQ